VSHAFGVTNTHGAAALTVRTLQRAGPVPGRHRPLGVPQYSGQNIAARSPRDPVWVFTS
jgi:hypothetical protein